MSTAGTNRRLDRLEHRFPSEVVPKTALERAVDRTKRGTATDADFTLIRKEHEESFVGLVLERARRHQLAWPYWRKPIGWDPLNWAGEIVAYPPGIEPPADPREELEEAAWFPSLEPTAANKKDDVSWWRYEFVRAMWVDAKLLVGLLDEQEDQLRQRMVDDPPSTDWRPTPTNCWVGERPPDIPGHDWTAGPLDTWDLDRGGEPVPVRAQSPGVVSPAAPTRRPPHPT